MRVVIIVLAVLALVAVLYFTGVGRSGLKACFQECEKTHCPQVDPDQIGCGENQAAFDRCRVACRKQHGDE